MTLKALARLQEQAATPEQSVAYVQKVFSQTGLSKWVQSVKARDVNDEGGAILCKGKTLLGHVAFEFLIGTKKPKPTVYFIWRDTDGLWLPVTSFDWLDDVGTGITKSDIQVSIRGLNAVKKELASLQKNLPDQIGFYEALVNSQIKIADGVKASGGVPI